MPPKPKSKAHTAIKAKQAASSSKAPATSKHTPLQARKQNETQTPADLGPPYSSTTPTTRTPASFTNGTAPPSASPLPASPSLTPLPSSDPLPSPPPPPPQTKSSTSPAQNTT
ncbi:hypothetical protein M501DRAFT_986724 [Patellaria atrata CBS 101060]|uniref:Uncharacterized protein n=1 Tax=Patellaria atrata CBS 101060 TaxID=1346257 RepID=A0A9P4S6B0_9PEZI|nr:hypothetical protein M501DRAFT_986724 [Patellaria atrata CBS 101060]